MMDFFKRNLVLRIGGSTEIRAPLTIRATVVKNLETGEPDYAMITLFNLKQGTRDELNSSEQTIELLGGYGTQEDLIFTGNVISVNHRHERTEWITTLHCGDGAKVLNEALINKTYEKGFKLGDLLRDIANTGGVTLENILGVNEAQGLPRGRSYSAEMKTVLDSLGQAHDFDWSIQDGELIIASRGHARGDPTYVVSARTGMVGTPDWINTGAHSKKLTKKDGVKFRVVALCLPSIKPGDSIIVKSESLQGRIADFVYSVDKTNYTAQFTVCKVQHDLDNRGGNFISQLECRVPGEVNNG